MSKGDPTGAKAPRRLPDRPRKASAWSGNQRMLSKHNSIQRDQLEMITLDQLVPANHLVRKIEGAIDAIDFTFISFRIEGNRRGIPDKKTAYQQGGCLVLLQLFTYSYLSLYLI
ncbi:UNVERIFIED_ORG: hypothetical protein ABIC97_000801 [Peribacillus simplex]